MARPFANQGDAPPVAPTQGRPSLPLTGATGRRGFKGPSRGPSRLLLPEGTAHLLPRGSVALDTTCTPTLGCQYRSERLPLAPQTPELRTTEGLSIFPPQEARLPGDIWVWGVFVNEWV